MIKHNNPQGIEDNAARISSIKKNQENISVAWPATPEKPRKRWYLAVQLKDMPETVESMGLKPIFDDKSPVLRRLFWLLVVAFGIAFAGYQIITQVCLYLTYPVNILVNVSYVSILPLPRVMVCNINQIRFSQIPPNSSGMNTFDYSDLFEPAIDAGYYDGQDWEQVFLQLSHPKESMIIQCTWEGLKCTADNFTMVHTDMGVCAELSGGKYHVHYTGEDYALRLLLYADVQEYMNSTTRIGFKVLISDESEPALPHAYGIYIPTGYLTSINIARQRIVNLPPPWENCGEVASWNKSDYSSKACQLECTANYLISRCNCTPSYVHRDGVPTCNPAQQEDCIGPAYVDYVSKQPACIYGTCPLECEKINYSGVVSQIKLAPWHLQFLMEQVNRSLDLQTWAHNIAEVRIFYADLVEEIITHKPGYTLLTLLCDVGGALGLIIGASIVSVLEVFDFFLMSFVSGRRQANSP